MVILKSTITVTPEVLSKELSLTQYVLSFNPTFDFFDLFVDFIADDTLLGIIRKVSEESNKLDINYVLSDEKAQSFIDWFGTQLPVHRQLCTYISETFSVINMTTEEFQTFYNNKSNTYSEVSFSTLF